MYYESIKDNSPNELSDPVNGKTYSKDIKLGSGAFGDVYKYVCKAEDANYAIKIMDMGSTNFKSFGIQSAKKEAAILRDYANSYICKYVSSFRDSKNFYIVMEYCSNGSLETYTKMNGLLNEKVAVKFMLCILNALEHLHNNGVIHRDIKPGNILLNERLSPQLADMGLSSKRSTKEEKRYHLCGTRAYAAPEVLDESPEGYNYKADLWSLAVTIYKLVFGQYPNINMHKYADSLSTKNSEIKFPNNIEVTPGFKSLMKFILKLNPEERPTIDEIRCHHYIKNLKPRELPDDIWKAIQNAVKIRKNYLKATQLRYSAKRIQAQDLNSVKKRPKTATVDTAARTPKHALKSFISLPRLSKFSAIKNLTDNLEEICGFINNDKTATGLLILTLFKPEIPQYVKDWFYTVEQSGIVYELIGGNIGLLSKDATSILTYNVNNSNNTNTHNIQSHSVHQTYTTDADPYPKIAKNLLNKKSLLENYQYSILNKVQSQRKNILLQRNCDSLYLSACFRFETGVVFFFSSSNIQITYNSCYIVLLSNKSRVFNLVYPSGLITTFKTIELEAYRIGLIKYKEPHKVDRAVVYLQLTKSILQNTVDYINNTTGTAT